MVDVNSRRRNFSVTMLAIAVAVAAVDQLSKIAVLATLEPGVAQPVFGDWFRFYLLFNSGAAFSFGTGMTWVFTVVQITYIAVIAWYSRRIHDCLSAISLALIAGGALGNLIDRLFRAPSFFVGHVVDFISVGSFAVFNLADSAITVGVGLFILAMLRVERRKERAEVAG